MYHSNSMYELLYWLLSEAELLLKKAIELSQAFEAAEKNPKEIQTP